MEGTPFEWSMWENFAEYNSGVTHNNAETFIRYFDLFAKYEAVEYLAKTGLFRMIQMYLWGNMTGRAVNWHGRTPNEIFKTRTTKADRKFLLNNGGWLDFSSIKKWETVNRMGRNRYSLEDVTRLLHGVWEMPKLLFRYVTIEKAIAYLKKQRENGSNGSIRDYEDYVRECLELGLDMKSKSTLYPKNLLQAHENLGKQIEYKKEKELEEQWIKRRESMKKKYGFSWQGMHIVVPEQVSDLITEGKAQKNCVGGYMQRVAKGETDVVFMFWHCVYRETEPMDMRKWLLIHSCEQRDELWKGIYQRELLQMALLSVSKPANMEDKGKAAAWANDMIEKREIPKYIISNIPDENGDYKVKDADTGEVMPFVAKFLTDLYKREVHIWACVQYMEVRV